MWSFCFVKIDAWQWMRFCNWIWTIGNLFHCFHFREHNKIMWSLSSWVPFLPMMLRASMHQNSVMEKHNARRYRRCLHIYNAFDSLKNIGSSYWDQVLALSTYLFLSTHKNRFSGDIYIYIYSCVLLICLHHTSIHLFSFMKWSCKICVGNNHI